MKGLQYHRITIKVMVDMFHVNIGHSPPDCLHLVFQPINNSVLLHLYIAGRLSLHKLTHSVHLKKKKLEVYFTNALSSL